MSIEPLVSVIIPAFNNHKFIIDTIESVFTQLYNNIEIIVVDDGSTDKTYDVVNYYGSRIKYLYQKNSGPSVARNTGILYCQGDFICFLDSDDLIVPEQITMQVDFFRRYPDVGIVFSDYRNFQGDHFSVNSHFQSCPDLNSRIQDRGEDILDNATALLAKENFGSACSFMIRRSLLPYVGGFEASLRSCEDFHFYYRLARYTKVGIINKIGMLRRLHDHNASSNTLGMLTGRIWSRKLLLETESDFMSKQNLKVYVSDRFVDYARVNADNCKYIDSLKMNISALLYNLSISRLTVAIRSILRTILMATRIYKPR